MRESMRSVATADTTKAIPLRMRWLCFRFGGQVSTSIARKKESLLGMILNQTKAETGRLLVNLELIKAGYPPIDIKFADRIAYYNAFGEYHIKHNLGAMEKLFAGYVNERLDSYLAML